MFYITCRDSKKQIIHILAAVTTCCEQPSYAQYIFLWNDKSSLKIQYQASRQKSLTDGRKDEQKPPKQYSSEVLRPGVNYLRVRNDKWWCPSEMWPGWQCRHSWAQRIRWSRRLKRRRGWSWRSRRWKRRWNSRRLEEAKDEEDEKKTIIKNEGKKVG